jgi:hypothetical protein
MIPHRAFSDSALVAASGVQGQCYGHRPHLLLAWRGDSTPQPSLSVSARPHVGRRQRRRAISVPLALVTAGTSRSLADSIMPRAALYPQVDTALCKQGVSGSSPLSSTRPDTPPKRGHRWGPGKGHRLLVAVRLRSGHGRARPRTPHRQLPGARRPVPLCQPAMKRRPTRGSPAVPRLTI